MASTSGEGGCAGQSVLRKNVSNPSNWKKNTAKRKRNAGEEYVAKEGEVKRRRVQQRGDGGDAYKRKCTRAYSLSCGGTNISVCATAFRNVLGVTSRRVYNAVDRVNPTGTPRADRRVRIPVRNVTRYEVSKKDANTEEEAQGIQAQWDEHLSFAKEGMKQELDNTEEDDSTEDEDEDHLEYDSDSEDIVDDPQPLQDEDNTGE
ncbi:hypothetical protein O3P69_014168 [Scylla paramamosain]|uniref:Uncharacterized protein n=1 Tax=Scylla paramamosain TaxID=85552 RepID=A0AAW0SC22_SCYPA